MLIAFNSFIPALLRIEFLYCKVFEIVEVASSTMPAELSFQHAFYLIRVVRVADTRVAWLVYLVYLRSHVLRAYFNFESKQAIWAAPK